MTLGNPIFLTSGKDLNRNWFSRRSWAASPTKIFKTTDKHPRPFELPVFSFPVPAEMIPRGLYLVVTRRTIQSWSWWKSLSSHVHSLVSKWTLSPILKEELIWLKIEVMLTLGGLDSWDQSRSRSRTSLASRLTFLKCQDFLDCWDWLSASVEIESLNRDKNKNRDKSRLYSIEIVEICRDVIFQTVEKISTVEMSFFKLSRKSWLSRPALCQCRDRESRSRPCRDKSRPPGLGNVPIYWRNDSLTETEKSREERLLKKRIKCFSTSVNSCQFFLKQNK